jgi:hypothetical protein
MGWQLACQLRWHLHLGPLLNRSPACLVVCLLHKLINIHFVCPLFIQSCLSLHLHKRAYNSEPHSRHVRVVEYMSMCHSQWQASPVTT